MEKLERGSADVVIDDNVKIAFVRWKDNKVVTVISSKYGLNPIASKKCNEGMGGVYRLDQNITTYMIAHRSNEWWWQIICFCVDLCSNNAAQIYQQPENPGQKPPDLLGFQHSIVDTYHRRYRKTTQISMFPGSRKKTRVSDEVRFDKLSHWIGKAKQGGCAECGKTTLYFCEKCNAALHPECFKEFYEQ